MKDILNTVTVLGCILWSIFCGAVFLYYLLTANGFAMIAWGGVFILSLLAVKMMLERKSINTHETRSTKVKK